MIKNADMSEDMQQDAIDCATQALEKFVHFHSVPLALIYVFWFNLIQNFIMV